MAAAISPAQDAEHATTPQEDDGSDDDDNDADNDDDDDGSGDGNGDGNGTRKYKQRRLKRPLNHHQAAIVYTASHEWKKVELEILARGLAIGETAKLIVGGTEAKASCIVTKYHTKGPTAETYRVLSPPSQMQSCYSWRCRQARFRYDAGIGRCAVWDGPPRPFALCAGSPSCNRSPWSTSGRACKMCPNSTRRVSSRPTRPP
jgi:hypothetical protein